MLLAIDFDGTLTDHDTIDWIAAHYAPDTFDRVDAAFSRGDLTVNECTVQQLAPITASEQDLIRFVLATVSPRPGLRELVDYCAGHGIEPVVVSAGFDNLITPFLQAHGVDLPVLAHTAEFTPDGIRVRFRERAQCDVCGEACKRAEVLALAEGRPFGFVGDGASDLCAAEVAELRFARHVLAAHLTREGLSYLPFEDLHDVRRGLLAATGVGGSRDG